MISGGGSKTNDHDSSGSSRCSGGSMKQETFQWWKKEPKHRTSGKKKEGAESKHASSTACTQGPISPKSSHGNQQHACLQSDQARASITSLTRHSSR